MVTFGPRPPLHRCQVGGAVVARWSGGGYSWAWLLLGLLHRLKPLRKPISISLRPWNQWNYSTIRHAYDIWWQYVIMGINITHQYELTHWGRVTHICAGKLTNIGSDNGLSPGRRQTIIWTNAGILLIGPLGTNFSEILIVIHTFSFKKMHLKNVCEMASILSWPWPTKECHLKGDGISEPGEYMHMCRIIQ